MVHFVKAAYIFFQLFMQHIAIQTYFHLKLKNHQVILF